MREAIANLLKHIRKYYGVEGWKEIQDIIDGVNTIGGDDCDYERFKHLLDLSIDPIEVKDDTKKD